jgi:hypothetical protein
MTSHEKPGFWQRFCAACKRGLLGKSGHDYMKQFSGGDDAYWDEAIAAQHWPRRTSTKPAADRSRS